MAEHHGPSALRPPTAVRAILAARIAEIITRGAATGELREDPQGVLAEALAALARLALARALEGRGTESELAEITDFFVRGAAP